MPKDVPFKLMTEGPIASRTRFKVGTRMVKSRPVQYPDSWPLLQKAVIYSKLQSFDDQRNRKVECTERRQSARSKGCMKLRLLESLGLKPERRTVPKRIGVGKKTLGSLGDHVTCKSLKGNSASQRKVEKVRVSSKNHRQTSMKSNARRKSRRNLRKAKRRKKTQRKSKRQSRSRRTKVSRKQRRRRCARLSRKRRDLKRRMEQREEISRRTVEVSPPCGHAQDGMLKQKNELNREWFDSGKDEIKEDPLNIIDLCRRLVKDLPGNPADCREDFDGKKNKLERDDPVHAFKVERDSILTQSDSEDSTRTGQGNNGRLSKNATRRTCVKELKALMKDDNSKRDKCIIAPHARRREMQRLKSVSLGFRKEQKSSNYESTGDVSPKNEITITQSNLNQATDLKNKEDVIVSPPRYKDGYSLTGTHEQDEAKDQEKTLPTNDDARGQEDRPGTTDEMPTEDGEQNQGQEIKDRQPFQWTETKHIARSDVKSSLRLKRRSQGRKRRGSDIQSRMETRRMERLKAKQRRMRRVYLDLLKKPRLRFKLLARNAFHKKKRSKEATRKKNRQYRPMYVKRIKKTVCPRRRRPNYPKTPSRRNDEGNGNVNCNVNNNQTETGIWCRVSGRLLRIGRYLLRKFHFFFW